MPAPDREPPSVIPPAVILPVSVAAPVVIRPLVAVHAAVDTLRVKAPMDTFPAVIDTPAVVVTFAPIYMVPVTAKFPVGVKVAEFRYMFPGNVTPLDTKDDVAESAMDPVPVTLAPCPLKKVTLPATVSF